MKDVSLELSGSADRIGWREAQAESIHIGFSDNLSAVIICPVPAQVFAFLDKPPPDVDDG